MSPTESYKNHMFIVDDADARIRSTINLLQFEKFLAGDLMPPGEQIGNFKRIPQGTQVKIDDVKVVQTGSKGSMIFARALSADGVKTFGWTSTANFRGKFINETLGTVDPKPRSDKFGPNADGSGVASGRVRFLLFPGSGKAIDFQKWWPLTTDMINKTAFALLESIGGEAAIEACSLG